MKKRLLASLLAFAFTGLGHAQNPIVTTESSGTFIRNDGQLKDTDGNPRPDLKYYGSFSDRQMYFAADKISHVWFKKGDTAITAPDTLGRMDMEFENSNTSAQIIAADQQQGYLNFFKEHIPNGVVNVPAYEKITYKDVYANTDVEAVKREGRIEYKVTFHPGANPSTFKLKFTGTTNLEIMPDGSLKAENHIGKAEFEKPTGEKKIGGQFVPVNVTLNKTGNDLISITIANYQANKEFVIRLGERKLPPVPIKPILKGKNHNVHWNTYYGGVTLDEGVETKIDNAGNIYVIGNTQSNNFPIETDFQTQFAGDYDAFVLKFDKNRERKWATYYGGASIDVGLSIAVDDQQYVYFTGYTQSTLFPTQDVFGTADYYQPLLNGNGNAGAWHEYDAFIVKLNSAGNNQVWATYFGGEGSNAGVSIALSSNAIYLVGETSANPIPTVTSTGYVQPGGNGSRDGLIARFSRFTYALQWSTHFGGEGYDIVNDCAVDNAGNLVIVGNTWSKGSFSCVPVAGEFPLCNPGGSAFVEGNHDEDDAFIAKFNGSNDLLWSTEFGGSSSEAQYGSYNFASIATDNSGNIFIAGTTWSSDLYTFITSFDNYYQSFGGTSDGFIAKFLSTGEKVWVTCYGGSDYESMSDIAIDSNGDIYLAGRTSSLDFPLKTRGLSYNQSKLNQDNTAGAYDGFVVWFNKNLTQVWSTYLGGTGMEAADGIAVNLAVNSLVVAGSTASSQGQLFPLRNLPGTIDYFDGSINGGNDSFIADFTVGCNPCARLAGIVVENDEPLVLISEDKRLMLYPNPANTTLYLQGAKDAQVKIYNIFGGLVYSGFSEMDLTTIDVSYFAKGMYILQINNGVDFIHQKIITE